MGVFLRKVLQTLHVNAESGETEMNVMETLSHLKKVQRDIEKVLDSEKA